MVVHFPTAAAAQVSVSGHKFVGSPVPCGVVIPRFNGSLDACLLLSSGGAALGSMTGQKGPFGATGHNNSNSIAAGGVRMKERGGLQRRHAHCRCTNARPKPVDSQMTQQR
eukprot:363900-Chlamydomonas_euryale.AAC.12